MVEESGLSAAAAQEAAEARRRSLIDNGRCKSRPGNRELLLCGPLILISGAAGEKNKISL